MSTSTIEKVETFLLDYGHKEGHCILNNDETDPSSFVWDGEGTTGTLNGVLRCDDGEKVEVVMRKDGITTWTGNYRDGVQAWTLKISSFTHDPLTGEIAGDVKRKHSKDRGIGGDDMGSFTGTKTRRLTVPAAR